jgi:mono/diheme cytochrome c family protein
MSATVRAGALLLLVTACGGGDRAARTDTTGMSSAPPLSEQPAATTPDSATTGMSPAAPESAATVNSRDSLTRPGRAAATGMVSRAASPKPAASKPTPPKAAPSSSPARQTASTQDTAKQDTTRQDTAKQAAAKPAGGGPTSPQLVALGDSIFHGQVAGGTCTACHGQDAKGTAVAPDLTDNQWINGDGSYDFIVHTVTTGVPQPKQHPAPMPPKGGATLSDQQVKAVAAYVYSLSHKS